MSDQLHQDVPRTQGFVLGAVFDFVLHCNSRAEPLIIGGGYPRDGLINEFETWAAKHKIGISKIDIETFRTFCKSGLFKQ